MIQQLAFALFNGVATGMAIFLVALGLTWMFGIMRMLNLAHGAFMMIGAYVAYSLLGHDPASLMQLLGASLVAGLVVTALGFVVDRVLLSRLRHVDPHYVLIATFALLMLCEGLVKLIWGEDVIAVNPPPELSDPVLLPGFVVSRYTLFVIICGLVVFAVVDTLLHRLWLSKLMRALATDAWMCGLMGMNVTRGLMFSVMISFLTAGLAGGILLSNQSLSPQLGESVLLGAFFAVVIGGLGSVRGAFVASILLGLADSVNGVVVPDYPGLAIYVVLAIFLVVRPNGLVPAIGTTVEHVRSRTRAAMRLGPKWQWSIAVFAGLVLASAPFWAGQGLLFVLGLTLIQAVLALSWNLLFGYAGLASFGHAGFFAIGAYATGVTMRAQTGLPFAAILLLSAVLGAAAAGLTGLLALRRLAGVFLAVLTVALSEMLRLIFSYIPAFGGEDGLAAIPRPTFTLAGFDLASSQGYYWLLLVVSALAALALHVLVGSQFGRMMSAVRQDPERAAFLGIDVFRTRLVAFMISGSVAALAGSLFAPWTRIVTLAEIGWLTSTQPILNSLLGGVGTFWGPVVGAFAYAGLTYATRTIVGLSEVMVGGALLIIILLAPNGLLGLAEQASSWRPMGRSVRRVARTS